MKNKSEIEKYIYDSPAMNDDGYSLSLLSEIIASKFNISADDDNLWNLFEEIFPERF